MYLHFVFDAVPQLLLLFFHRIAESFWDKRGWSRIRNHKPSTFRRWQSVSMMVRDSFRLKLFLAIICNREWQPLKNGQRLPIFAAVSIISMVCCRYAPHSPMQLYFVWKKLGTKYPKRYVYTHAMLPLVTLRQIQSKLCFLNYSNRSNTQSANCKLLSVRMEDSEQCVRHYIAVIHHAFHIWECIWPIYHLSKKAHRTLHPIVCWISPKCEWFVLSEDFCFFFVVNFSATLMQFQFLFRIEYPVCTCDTWNSSLSTNSVQNWSHSKGDSIFTRWNIAPGRRWIVFPFLANRTSYLTTECTQYPIGVNS